jgi:hypothetical protein
MKLNIAKTLLFANLILIACVALLDIILPVHHNHRYIVIYIQASILGISIVYLFITYLKKTIKLTGFHHTLLFFIFMLTLSGLFSPARDRLPPLLYSTMPFFIFYYTSFKGYLHLKIIERFAVVLLIVFAFESYIGIYARASKLDAFYMKADNVGNSLMFLILFFSLDLKKSINIVLILVSYLLVLISLKRGAMLASTVAMLVVFWYVLTKIDLLSQKEKSKIVLLSIFSVSILIFILISYWEIITYRFIYDSSGGSGRTKMWSLIIENWQNAELLKQVFGFGFFKVPELMFQVRGVPYFAHSDWIQILYDHGIIGIVIYSSLLLFYLYERRIIIDFVPDMYAAYLVSLSLWILKSIWSGVYLTKGAILLFIIIGYILGEAHKKQKIHLNAIRKKVI